MFDKFGEFDSAEEPVLAAGDTAEEAWEALYGEAFPAKAEVAPVQQKPTPRKEKKVHKVEAPQKRTEPEKLPEEQLPGQDTILKHPEWLPDAMKTGQTDTDAGEQGSTAATGENGTEDAAGKELGTDDEEDGREPDIGAESAEAAAAADGGADGTGIMGNDPDGHETENPEEIWNRAAISVAKLNLFFQNWTAESMTAGEIPEESLQAAYHCAVEAAAELERMIHG